MQTTTILRIPAASRSRFHTSVIALRPSRGNEGHPHAQAVKSGKSNADKSTVDAASSSQGKQASKDASGNPEKVGFAEQVGSASGDRANKKWEGKSGSEEATPPGYLDAIKSALGFKTTSGEVKQNRGGGVGVGGTGTFGQSPPKGGRGLHNSSVRWDGARTQGTAPQSSRQPKDESVGGEQNAHLKHKDPKARDSGKGNAAENPKLPSHQQQQSPSSSQGQRRAFSTTAYLQNDKSSVDRVQKREADRAKDAARNAHQSTSLEEPYGSDEKLRYGGKENFANETGAEKPGSGPEGDSAGGRKPEGKH